MSPAEHERARFARVDELFGRCLELPAEARTAFLRDACRGEPELRAEVQQLLALREGAGDFLATAPARPGGACGGGDASGGDARHDAQLGAEVGGWKLVQRIGQGGMGAVYLAERGDPALRLRAALKLVRSELVSAELLRRFADERRALAALRHPNIARLLDGGSTADGRPFLVMEHVEGLPIDRHCRQRGLSQPEIVALFGKVVAAVAHAHGKLVVHRDLKPSNVLVTAEGEPKLLDFGIAKILDPTGTDARTLTLERRLTPAYASPEQVRGEPIGTASDIYSLGVLLHELLTGELPYRLSAGTTAELQRAVLEQEPARGGTALPADLWSILSMALRKEPARRYATAEAFGEDLRRWSLHLPVTARGDSTAYRVARFVRRNRALTAAAALAVIALIGGTVTATVYGLAAEEQRAEAEHFRGVSDAQHAAAEERLGQLRDLTRRLTVELHDAIETLPGATAARKLLVDATLQYLDEIVASAGDDFETLHGAALGYRNAARLLGRMDYGNVGDTAGALEVYERLLGVSARMAELRPGDRVAVNERYLALAGAGDMAAAQARTDEAAAHYGQAQQVVAAWLTDNPDDFDGLWNLANLHGRLASIHERRGEAEQSAASQQAALPLSRRLCELRPDEPVLAHNLIVSLALTGQALLALERNDTGLELLTEASRTAETAAARWPDNALFVADQLVAWAMLAAAERQLGRLTEALVLYRRCVEAQEAQLRADPGNHVFLRRVADYRIELGETALLAGERDEAVAAGAAALPLAQQAAAAAPGDVNAALLLGKAELLAAATLPAAQAAEALAHCEAARLRSETLLAADPGNALLEALAARARALRDTLRAR